MAKITIFGLAGTGKGDVSRMLSKRLNFSYLAAGDMIRQNAQELGITLPEFKRKRMSDPSFDHKLDEFTKEYGKTHNDFIFESRLPWYFIPDSFKIKLTCDFNVRIKRIFKREGMSLEDQKKITLERERTDAELFKKLYGIEDMNADEHFDYILDTTDLTVEEATEKIFEALPHPN